MQRVMVHVRVPVRVELVAEQRRRLRGRVQVQVVVVVAHVDAGRQRVIVAGRILAVLLRAHGAVTWMVEGKGVERARARGGQSVKVSVTGIRRVRQKSNRKLTDTCFKYSGAKPDVSHI